MCHKIFGIADVVAWFPVIAQKFTDNIFDSQSHLILLHFHRQRTSFWWISCVCFFCRIPGHLIDANTRSSIGVLVLSLTFFITFGLLWFAWCFLSCRVSFALQKKYSYMIDNFVSVMHIIVCKHYSNWHYCSWWHPVF